MLYKIRNLVKQRKRDQGYRLLIRNLFIPEGSRLAITGPSGCGKSTSLDLLGLVLQPDSVDEFIFSPHGEEYDIMRIWQKGSQDELANLRLANMGYVLQTGDLLPFLDVKDNILLTARLAERDFQNEQAMEIAEQLGIAGLMEVMPSTLSVGERQRVAIARALVAKPDLILADEPTAALDPMHAGQVMAAFLQVLGQTGASLIVVTHNAPWALNAGLTEVPFELLEDSGNVTAVLDYSPAGGFK